MSIAKLQPVTRSANRRRLAGLCAMCALLCASCRTPSAHNYSFAPGVLALTGAGAPADTAAQTAEHGSSSSPAALPATAYAGDAQPAVAIEPVHNSGIPLPQGIVTPWAPPGIAGPWPHDEYLEDGGDRDVQVTVAPDFQVGGLDLEDTVIHYDTIDGRTIVKPTNKVCIYAPRFGAVRKVTSVYENEQRDNLVEAGQPVKPARHDEKLLATTAVQPLQPRGEIGARQISIERLRQPAGRVSQRLLALGVEGAMKAYEDFSIIRCGILQEDEKPRLAIHTDAAIVWTDNKAVQVVLEGQEAKVAASDQRVQTTFRADTPNNPCLRVYKVASTNMARPGDTVDFTIRFDNVGDQAIGNVTLVDNLTTRLEYIEGSAQASRPADFSADRNEGDSLVLRWEFIDPLPAGAGGLVRFHCRVR